MEHASDKKSVLFLNIAVMLFGLSGVIARFISASPLLITFGRAAFSACLLLLLLVFKKETLKPEQKKDAPLLLIAGAILAAHWVCFFKAIQTASVAVGTITFSTFPLFLTFLEPLVFREKFRKINLFYAAALLFGAAVTVPEFLMTNQTTAGILWGMTGSLTYAALTLFNRHFAVRYSGVKICFYEQSAAALVLLPALFFTELRLNAQDVAGIAVIGTVCTALGFSLFVSAQKKVKAQTAGILSGMETVYGILLALLFLGAVPSVREIVGGAIILAVAALFSARVQRAS